MRGSPSSTQIPAPIVSAPATMVRSFQTSNGAPIRPTRRWRYTTGPPLSSRIRIAATSSTGETRARSSAASTTSRARLTAHYRSRLRMRILYLHQFFITRAGVGGTRSYEFARRFVERGHAVRMVTAAAGRRDVDGIEVVGARGGYSDYVSATHTSYPRRMLAFARFALGASREALRGPRPDVVYATSPPLTIALPALLAATRHRAPLVFEVRDLWPEAPIQMGALPNPLARRGPVRSSASCTAAAPG